MAKYRLKTNTINAHKWDSSLQAVHEFLGEHKDLVRYDASTDKLLLKTWEGVGIVTVGSYIVEESYQPGCYIVIEGDKFEEDHELIEEEPDGEHS